MLVMETVRRFGGCLLRGRKPCSLDLAGKDRAIFQPIARSDCLPGFQVRRARIVLAVAAGQSVQTIALHRQCDAATAWRTCQRRAQAGLPGFLADGRQRHSGRAARISPLPRARVIQLACLEPIAKGLHSTHWTRAGLARQAVLDGIVDAISARTVCRSLRGVDRQPHRTRTWETARLGAEFLGRTVRSLWCPSYADHLARRGFWVVCADELPNFQVLERPMRRAVPGSVEHQECAYKRHGTVNVLVLLVVHTGRMGAVCLEEKNAAPYTRALRHFRRRHRGPKGVYLIHDGDPRHTAAATQDSWDESRPWWRPRQTPAHASWRNRAEMLLEAFGCHYLDRAPWRGREELRNPIGVAWPEYNRLQAHPFEWEWTTPQMKQWFAKHTQ